MSTNNFNKHNTSASNITTSTSSIGSIGNNTNPNISRSNIAAPPVSSSMEKKSGWGDLISRRSSTNLPAPPTSISSSSKLNKLHQSILAKDLGKVKQILTSKAKAKQYFTQFDQMDQTPLCAALKQNTYDIVKEIIHFYQTNKMDINEQDKNGYTPLHVAASNCDDQILVLLLNYDGINVNITNEDKNSPLHYFCQKFKSPNCQEPFQLFLKKGVDVNAQNKNGETPLHKSIMNSSVRLLMVNLLLEAGGEVNVLNYRGESPLHFAVYLGREDLVSVLVKAGADITIKGGSEKKTCYELALSSQPRNNKVINFLKNVQDIYNWLKSIDLETFWLNFVKEEIFMDLLPDIDDKTLLDSVGITSSGNRMKIIKQCRLLKEQLANQPPPPPLTTTTTTTSTGKSNITGDSFKSTPNSMDSTGSISSDDLKISLTNLEHWVIDPNEVEYTLKLGSGSSGKVYKGLYKGKEVAVKVLRAITTQSQLDEFKKEFQIMGSIRSQFMVTFYGACIEPKLCMVMEYCSKDSLYHVMNTKSYDIGWERFFQFTMQMTLGVQCLHNWNPQIVHRDFKSLNLLVNEDWECKVSDFGLSRFNTADNLETLSKIRGTFAYCSPEIANGTGCPYTTKSDVYSIGIVFWELIIRVLTGEYSRPYSEYSHIKMDFQIMLNSKEGLRPTLPQCCPVGLSNLYYQCVHQDAAQRPSCEEIIETLNRLRHEYMSNKSHWDSLIKKPTPTSSPPINSSSSSRNNSSLSTTPTPTSPPTKK
ncbi:hypothetical protein CYY_008198 [Polysphondylium violaceum]|uniref:non-specific serine/threonine protein kinase n=1 Tax=Polysphondylium violaceum TaxID=133409 RepID=A0A8J4V1I5_9MYCE|nr:hypothetical protein CYY_008198 [Polysphondylium violaceum]